MQELSYRYLTHDETQTNIIVKYLEALYHIKFIADYKYTRVNLLQSEHFKAHFWIVSWDIPQ